MAKKIQENTLDRAISDFPKHAFESAIRVADVIEQKNGGRPLPPAEVAIAIGLSPGSSDFRVLLSSSIKYGMTAGSYNQERILVTPLGTRVVAPSSEQDRRDATKAAVLHNVTFRRIFEHFRGKKLPDESFFENAVVREFGVRREHAAKCVKIFRQNMEFAGLLRQATTGLWLSSEPAPSDGIEKIESNGSDANGDAAIRSELLNENVDGYLQKPPMDQPAGPQKNTLRVFISHSRNKEIVDQIKTMLNVAEVPFDIAVEQESTAIPVSEKVFAAMRNCNAAIICVTADHGPVQSDFKLNENVLIEIGAAFVLYEKRVILAWDRRLPVPSNLQGLYRCEYEGNELSWSTGMKLMEAIKGFRLEK